MDLIKQLKEAYGILRNVEQKSNPNNNILKAITEVESKGNLRAVGDKNLKDKAYGPLQIRQPVLDDVNKYYKTMYTVDHLTNQVHSEDIFNKYIDIYATKKRLGHEPTPEDKARIWNGGPNGFRKNTTLAYWNKVKEKL